MCYAGVAEWQTRMFKGHVRKSVGSTPTARTKKNNSFFELFFCSLIFYFFSFHSYFILLNKQTKQSLKHCKKNKKEKNCTKLLLLLIWCINRSVYFTAKYNSDFYPLWQKANTSFTKCTLDKAQVFIKIILSFWSTCVNKYIAQSEKNYTIKNFQQKSSQSINTENNLFS